MSFSPMKAEFINPFLNSMKSVMEMMAQIELTAEKPIIKKDDVSKGDVTGIIGMVGEEVRGSMSVTFEADVALEAMQRMLGESPRSINDDVIDMVGEITNMVTGGAKNELSEKGFEFEMATPTIVKGKSHFITHGVDGPTIVMPFNSEFGKCFVEICFVSKKG
jgi:chemotaxis protein CheX